MDRVNETSLLAWMDEHHCESVLVRQTDAGIELISPALAGFTEAKEILGIKSPNLNRVDGILDLPAQTLKAGRIWLRNDLEALAAKRAAR